MEVLAYAWEVVQDGDLMLLENGAWTDAGDHEQLWGLEGPSREDHFMAGVQGVGGVGQSNVGWDEGGRRDENARGGSVPSKQNTLSQCVVIDMKIRAFG